MLLRGQSVLLLTEQTFVLLRCTSKFKDYVLLRAKLRGGEWMGALYLCRDKHFSVGHTLLRGAV